MNITHYQNDAPICPHCEVMQSVEEIDLTEGSNAMVCQSCGEMMEVIVEISVTYSTRKGRND